MHLDIDSRKPSRLTIAFIQGNKNRDNHEGIKKRKKRSFTRLFLLLS